MTGRVLAGYRHDLVITYRTSRTGHALAILAGAAIAAFAVFGLGV